MSSCRNKISIVSPPTSPHPNNSNGKATILHHPYKNQTLANCELTALPSPQPFQIPFHPIPLSQTQGELLPGKTKHAEGTTAKISHELPQPDKTETEREETLEVCYRILPALLHRQVTRLTRKLQLDVQAPSDSKQSPFPHFRHETLPRIDYQTISILTPTSFNARCSTCHHYHPLSRSYKTTILLDLFYLSSGFTPFTQGNKIN